jgi:hypothetical protein
MPPHPHFLTMSSCQREVLSHCGFSAEWPRLGTGTFPGHCGTDEETEAETERDSIS